MTDQEREQLIDEHLARIADYMERANDPVNFECRGDWRDLAFHTTKIANLLINSRRPEYVAQLERERGLT